MGVGAELFRRARRGMQQPLSRRAACPSSGGRYWRARASGPTTTRVFCMEVLEHVVDGSPVLSGWRRLLAPGGALIISVPVETGVPIMVKQIVRRLAGWRKIGHYPGTTPTRCASWAPSSARGLDSAPPGPVFDLRRRTLPRSQGLQLDGPARAAETAIRRSSAASPARSRGSGPPGDSSLVRLPPPPMTQLRVGVVCDLREEGWHSMDLIADMLIDTLPLSRAAAVAATRLCPPMVQRWTRCRCSAERRERAWAIG